MEHQQTRNPITPPLPPPPHHNLVNSFVATAFSFVTSEGATTFNNIFYGLKNNCADVFGLSVDSHAFISNMGSGERAALDIAFPNAKVLTLIVPKLVLTADSRLWPRVNGPIFSSYVSVPLIACQLLRPMETQVLVH